MEKVAPSGSVYQAGTLSGNPLAMAAGIAMLREIGRRSPYEELERKSAHLESAIRGAIRGAGAEDRVTWQRAGSLSTLFFTAGPVTDFAAARRSDTARYAAFFHAMRERGIFLPPAQFEAWFVSTAHTDADLSRTARAVEESLRIALP
jgi:glutamate-1-semialdehyde 2,1-aminomutase